MAKHGESGHFVTVLPISEKGTSHAQIRTPSGIPLPKRPSSAPNVTVLEVKNTAQPLVGYAASEILDHATIYRLPGERLGMALKFVGGTNAGDTVSKVFIQSINPDSPASRAQSKYAPIREGDEILKIGERDVTSMTRLDCVTLLRDSPVCINLIIRHMSGFIQLPVEPTPTLDAARVKREPPPIPPRKASSESPPVLVKSPSTKSLDRIGNGSIVRPSMPPPLPPRKISNDDTANQSTTNENRSQSVPPPPPPRKDELRLTQQIEVDPARAILQRTRSAPSSEERPRFMRPAEAEAYTDLFADDDDNYIDESDDTASSVSTVIDRLHSRSSTANSSFSEHAYGYDRPPIPRFELEKAMHPLMEMERKMPEVPPRPSVHKLPLEDIELTETPDPQPAAGTSEKLQESTIERSAAMANNIQRTATETDDSKCQIIAAKCQSPLLIEDSNRSRKIVVDAPVLLDKPDLEPIVQDDSSSSSSEDDLVGMERCSPSGDSFNSSSSSADSVVDASSPVPCSPILADQKRTPEGSVSESILDSKLTNLPPQDTEKESATVDASDDLQPEKFVVSSDVDSGLQEENSTLAEKAELLQTNQPDLERTNTVQKSCSQPKPDAAKESAETLTTARVAVPQIDAEKTEEDTEKMMTLNYSSGRLPPDGREFPSNFDEPKAWKEVFRGHKSLSVDDSGVFCSTPSSDESHSPTQKSPSPAFSSENLLLSNQYTSPISGDRRGSMSSVYSKFREASQRRYSGLLMSMLEPTTVEPKSKLKGLVLSKSDAPASTASKVLPVIVTNPVVVKVESTPVICQKAQTTDVPRAVPLGAAATFRKSLGLGDVNDWDTPSRPAPPLPGPASEDVPDAPSKGDLIERYLNSYQDQENDERLKSNRSGSCANIATIKDAELFARSSIGETRSKWQSMEFQTPPQGPPPVPPRPASRQTDSSRNSFASALKSAKSEASLNIISPSNGMTDSEAVSGPQNFRALAAKWEQRSSRDTAPPIPARKSSDPRIVLPKPATRSSVPNQIPALPPNFPPPVRPAPRGTSDVKKTFEEVPRPIRTVEHKRFSSVDSDDSGNSSTSTTREQYSSLTSLASTSSSLISPQDLQQLIDEANQSLQDEEGVRGENIDIYVVVLHKDSPTSGAGISLAGGCDYENKEITVHKVITGSAADRDGRIRRGDRVLSINGKTLKATTHREALDILKSPRPELVLVLSRDTSGRSSSGARSSLSRASSISSVLDVIDEPTSDGPLPTFEGSTVIVLEKDKVGLGFTLQGGKDSPLGNKPLTINRIFSCGAAERDGRLQPGDELLAINNTVTTNMSRTEAWNFLKKLSEGKISFTIRQQSR